MRRPSGRTPASELPSGLEGTGVLIPALHDVQAYLADHPDMAEILPRLCRSARSQLPADAQFSLELYHDRESEDSCLTLYVRQVHYSPGLLAQIETAGAKFDDILRDRWGWLLLTTDYRSPI